MRQGPKWPGGLKDQSDTACLLFPKPQGVLKTRLAEWVSLEGRFLCFRKKKAAQVSVSLSVSLSLTLSLLKQHAW